MRFEYVKVLRNEKIAEDIYMLLFPFKGEVFPGQFFMLRNPAGKALLGRPISVCDYEDGIVRVVYQTVGIGTCSLAGLKAGDELAVTGSLGNGFPMDVKGKRIALVSGGVGTAPMLYTLKSLIKNGYEAAAFNGYRSEVYLIDEFKKAGGLKVATEDGSYGEKGYVTSLFNPEDYDFIFCCGPMPMMKAVKEIAAKAKTKLYISLENKMGCGIGACLCCTCTIIDGTNTKTCDHGPVFRGEVVNLDA